MFIRLIVTNISVIYESELHVSNYSIAAHYSRIGKYISNDIINGRFTYGVRSL